MWEAILIILSPIVQYIDSRKVRLSASHIPVTAAILFGQHGESPFAYAAVLLVKIRLIKQMGTRPKTIDIELAQ